MAKKQNEPEILEREPETEVQKEDLKETKKETKKSKTLRKFSKFQKGNK